MILSETNVNRYDVFFLRRDMDNMAYFFEYGLKYFKELFNIEVAMVQVINRFMVSDMRYEIDLGHPQLLSMAGKDWVRKFVEVDCEGDYKQFEGTTPNFAYRQLYWVGQMYAYIHYHKNILSKDLVQIMPLDMMLEHYWLGHERSRQNYLESIEHLFIHKSL